MKENDMLILILTYGALCLTLGIITGRELRK
jgi:hypothetical protein